MDTFSFPKKICQYGEDCYRKNPIHFKEFSHPHLEKILLNGVDSTTEEYKIPAEVIAKDVVKVQLQILEKIFPKLAVQSSTADDNGKLKEEPKKPATATTTSVQSDGYLEPKEKIRPTTNVSDDQEASTSHSSRQLSSQSTDNSSLNSRTRHRSPSPVAQTSTKPNADNSRLSKKPKITKNINDYIKVVLPKGRMEEKLRKAAPYNFFLTTITDSKLTHNEPLSITFQEILDESLGEIESSVQINFMVDVGWLLGHYYFAGCLDTPLLILYGDETPDLATISNVKPQVTAVKVQMGSAFATHHTKMMLLGYKDGSMRVVISTANLYEDDWHNRTQGLWISPKLEALPEESDTSAGESPTGFRNDLLLYLNEYKISKLQPWIARIRKTDFGSINVFLVASVPGGFRETPRGHLWGHPRLGYLLNKHSAQVDDSSPVVAQSSSIGSLGPNSQSWILSEFVISLRKDSAPLGIRKVPSFKMIYPSFGNVKNSHDGMLGGGCLPYGKKTNDKQPWLKDFLYQWRAKERFRNQAMPHIKTYSRWSDRGLFWFVLTSANLSKAAWGAFNKSAKLEPTVRIFNYEVGVLFVPKFVIGESVFPMNGPRDGIPPFPVPYDIPLSSYGSDDTPFLMDHLTSMGY